MLFCIVTQTLSEPGLDVAVVGEEKSELQIWLRDSLRANTRHLLTPFRTDAIINRVSLRNFSKSRQLRDL